VEGKLTRRSHGRAEHKSDKKRFHSDTFGPCPLSYLHKCRYAVIYIYQPMDMWFLSGLHQRTASETLAVFRNAHLVSEKYGHAVNVLLSDKSREYINDDFRKYLADNGILSQLSAPGRQDSNGRAERAWRTLTEATVTHIAQSGLGKSFWLYSFEYTMFWRNRGGSPSAFEEFFHFTPHLPARHPFGCLVMFLAHDPAKTKFDSRARRGVNLGPALHSW
jgi:hypothetical protein